MYVTKSKYLCLRHDSFFSKSIFNYIHKTIEMIPGSHSIIHKFWKQKYDKKKPNNIVKA